MCSVWNFRNSISREWFSVMCKSQFIYFRKKIVFKEALPHPWGERWMDVSKKNETQFSDECKDRNLAWHQMSLPWWILFFFFFLIFTSKCRRVIRAKFISFLINFFATYCNILSVNNEMKMLQILQCVVSRRKEEREKVRDYDS